MDAYGELIELRKDGASCDQALLFQWFGWMRKRSASSGFTPQKPVDGMGITGKPCGVLVGATALLGMYAGVESQEQAVDLRHDLMVVELVEWFKSEYGGELGKIRCEEILASRSRYNGLGCRQLMADVLQKVKELLVEYGYDLEELN